MSSSAYTTYGIAFQMFAGDYVLDDVTQTHLHAEVAAALQLSSDPDAIVQYLVNKGIIKTTADTQEAAKIVNATIILSSQRSQTNGWSCCMHDNGSWYPFHLKYGWDLSQRCAG
jgi:hypothetical protein